VTNAATAYAGLKISGLDIRDEAIQAGFEKVSWPCRFELVRREPPVVLDSAHNQDSFEKLANTLEKYFPGRAVLLIFGSSEDKNMVGMLDALKGRVRLILATRADHPRATAPEKIAETAAGLGIPCEVKAPVEAALARALDLADQGDEIVLSAGSMFVTAEVKTAWEKFIANQQGVSS
jgi:dihydrofolate synthase/folylpolyglutamate synthase